MEIAPPYCDLNYILSFSLGLTLVIYWQSGRVVRWFIILRNRSIWLLWLRNRPHGTAGSTDSLSDWTTRTTKFVSYLAKTKTRETKIIVFCFCREANSYPKFDYLTRFGRTKTFKRLQKPGSFTNVGVIRFQKSIAVRSKEPHWPRHCCTKVSFLN